MGTSEECELLLKLFEMLHAGERHFGVTSLAFCEGCVGLPVAGLSALAVPLRLSPEACVHLASVGLPWARAVTAECECLMSVDYEGLMRRPLY